MTLHQFFQYLSRLTRKGSKCNFFSKKEFFGKSDSPGHTDYSKEKISKKACLEVELWSFEVGEFMQFKWDIMTLIACVSTRAPVAVDPFHTSRLI